MKTALIFILLLVLPLFVFTQSNFNFGIKSQFNYTMYTAHSEETIDGNLFKQDYLNAGGAIGAIGSFTVKEFELSLGLGTTSNQVGLRADRIIDNDPQSYFRTNFTVYSKFIDLSISLPIFETNESSKFYANLSYQLLFSRISESRSEGHFSNGNYYSHEIYLPEFSKFNSQNIGLGVKFKKLVFNTRYLEFGLNYNLFLNKMSNFGLSLEYNNQIKTAIISPQIQQFSFSMAFWFGRQ